MRLFILTIIALFTGLTHSAQASTVCSQHLEQNVGIAIDYKIPKDLAYAKRRFGQSFVASAYEPRTNKAVGRYVVRRTLFFNWLKFGVSKKYLHDAGLQAIYSNYGSRVNDQLVELVIDVEKKLPLNRQVTYFVFNAINLVRNNSSIFKEDQEFANGFIRIFDGNIYANKKDPRSPGSYQLPLERILEAQGKKTQAVDILREQNNLVFEIGKYFINKNLEPEASVQVRHAVLLWLISHIKSLSREEQSRAYFFAHVASRAHRIAYQRFFGFKVVDDSLSANLDSDEAILVVSAAELLEQLDAQTKDRIQEPNDFNNLIAAVQAHQVIDILRINSLLGAH